MSAFATYSPQLPPQTNPPINPPTSWGMDQQSLMLQMGLHYGQTVLQGGEQSFMRHLPVISGLRRYFRVDNQYVKGKLGILFFPFRRKFYKVDRVGGNGGGGGEYYDARTSPISFGGELCVNSQGINRSPTTSTGPTYPTSLPTNDLYAFDLYLPLMGAVTYVILSGFLHGLHHNRMTNEELLASASSLIFWLLVEVFILKIASYILRLVPDITVLDLISLCGYKYITICFIMLLREILQLESDAFYIGFMAMYVLFANGYFVIKIVNRMYQREERTPPNAKLLAYSAVLLQIPFVIWLAVKPFR